MAKQAADWDVIVVGGVNTDYLIQGASLPGPGETVEGKVFHEGPGGKALNQAVAVARLGGRVALLARVGRDARGDALLATMEREGVDPRFVQRDSTQSTGVALILVGGDGEKQIMTAPGANRSLGTADVESARHALERTRILLAPLEAPLDVLRAAAGVARSAGAPFVLDAGPALRVPSSFLRLVDVLRANAAEASALTQVDVRDRDSALRAGRLLQGRGIKVVVLQAGDEGNLLLSEHEVRFFPRRQVASVDATGAGDAFVAGFAMLVAEGRSYSAAGEFANAAAALATTVLGAQGGLPTRPAVEAFLRDASRPGNA
jgi:ribokinase